MGKIAEKRTKNRASDERHKPFTLRDYDRAYLDDKKKKAKKQKQKRTEKPRSGIERFQKGGASPRSFF